MLTLLTSYTGSIIVGCCIGYLYGLLFIYQKKGALFCAGQNSVSALINQIVLTMVRISIIAAIIWYLLPLPKIHFILVMMNFFIFFWIVVTQYKGGTP